ncbi:MAG: hypothetical protein CMG64_00515 [Candidatus Marinimicrobia bacterium]|nr:hypothetical protein [Candidatus Neomarinimicrobiota bacterium]|tara:strand:+ start:4746 stop:5099 length:354 start_codon:yes stop_codon:yes gene_type:complete
MKFQYKINTLKIYAYHGVYDYEKKYGQLFNVDFQYSLDSDILNGEFDKIIDYVDIINEIQNYFINNRFDMLEPLANNLLDFLILEFNLKSAKISIRKLSPIMVKNIGSIEVELEKNV